MNVFNDENMKNLPFLLVFDKINENVEYIIEMFRTKINLISVIYNIQILSFDEKEISLISYGMDWLVENMPEL